MLIINGIIISQRLVGDYMKRLLLEKVAAKARCFLSCLMIMLLKRTQFA